jgi:hypothetical protein
MLNVAKGCGDAYMEYGILKLPAQLIAKHKFKQFYLRYGK